MPLLGSFWATTGRLRLQQKSLFIASMRLLIVGKVLTHSVFGEGFSVSGEGYLRALSVFEAVPTMEMETSYSHGEIDVSNAVVAVFGEDVLRSRPRMELAPFLRSEDPLVQGALRNWTVVPPSRNCSMMRMHRTPAQPIYWSNACYFQVQHAESEGPRAMNEEPPGGLAPTRSSDFHSQPDVFRHLQQANSLLANPRT